MAPKAKIVVEFLDDRCNAEEGISVVRRIASGNAFVAVGPTCSNVAEPLFGILQKKVGDASDTGLQFPIFTDVAIKVGLAKISEWSFRNVPSEFEMYTSLFDWLKTTQPDLKTIYGGVEEDFAHSRATWYARHEGVAAKEGFAGAGRVQVAARRHQLLHPGARGQEGATPTSSPSRRIRSPPAAC